MDDLKLRAAALHQDALVWDSHACLPLHPDADLAALERHRRAGVDFVSVNIGMDMNPLEQIMAVIASFRAQLRARPERFIAVEDADDVARAKAEGKLAVAFDLEGGVPLGERPEMVRCSTISGCARSTSSTTATIASAAAATMRTCRSRSSAVASCGRSTGPAC
jgi:microsomal dipeptidase-like Zn-dependent dipeptidase